MGYETAKRMMNAGRIEYQKIGKQYKIKVSKDEVVNKEMKEAFEESVELKACIRAIQDLVSHIKI